MKEIFVLQSNGTQIVQAYKRARMFLPRFPRGSRVERDPHAPFFLFLVRLLLDLEKEYFSFHSHNLRNSTLKYNCCNIKPFPFIYNL